MNMVTRRRPLAALACAAAGLLAALSCDTGRGSEDRAKAPGGPNVVLVSIDTLRADRVNSYGYEARRTSPRLDALAREGILFENHITAAPWTTPAHLSLLTSLDPSTHGMTQAFFEMYDGLFGGREFFKLPERRVTLAEALRGAGLRTAAFTGGGPLDPSLGFGQGFEEYHTSMFKLRERNVAEMLDWLGAHRDERFFLFWHHFEVHAPYLHTDFLSDVLPPAKAARLRAATQKLTRAHAEDVWPGVVEVQTSAQWTLLDEQKALTRDVCEALYTGGVLAADRWLGRLLDRLRELGLYEHTLIVVTSDHGDEMAERKAKNFYDVHGHSLYEEIVHVPLVIRLPEGRAAGTRVSGVSRTIDVMPTVLDVLGVPPANDEMQGRSLGPDWTGPGDAPERVAFTEALAKPFEKKSLRTARYKYILNVHENMVKRHGRSFLPDRPLRPQLFDLETDPGERTNLLVPRPDEGTKARADSLDQALRQHVAGDRGEAEPTRLDESTMERLRALGYLER